MAILVIIGMRVIGMAHFECGLFQRIHIGFAHSISFSSPPVP
jgi:hypothetical protein